MPRRPRTQQVDIVKAVLGDHEMLVYGEARLRHIVADGEPEELSVARIPIGRVESAQVLEACLAPYRHLTMADVYKIGEQVPGMELAMLFDPRIPLPDEP